MIDNHLLPFIVRQRRKTNLFFPFPFAANKWKFAVFCLQQMNRSIRFLSVPFTGAGTTAPLATMLRYISAFIA
jgi:hypothetical protein